jgi:ubiquinone/menaquinone biosynthesis C-methylase UbiE
MENISDDSCNNNCSLFDFMANTVGIKVLHPGGYEATKKICSLSKLDKSSHVLDLACGAGTTSFYLSKKYNCTVSGVDISSTLIDSANKNLRKRRNKDKIDFQVANALNLPYSDNTFDFIILQAFFILVDEKEKALDEIYRVLKPGGYFGSLELGWFKTPPKDVYTEILNNTCTNFIPRLLKFNEWEELFKSKNLNLIKTITNPMTSGMLQMVKIEGILNFIKIMFKMISQAKTRKKMMSVQKTFKKYNDYLGYGLFVLTK